MEQCSHCFVLRQGSSAIQVDLGLVTVSNLSLLSVDVTNMSYQATSSNNLRSPQYFVLEVTLKKFLGVNLAY